ncbi:hypothetical protein B0H17DRAFT_221789 [Mycena rosella]|uniref:Uncharacterized protein n=1 Tax=Mycena rosella TaxID=1033263 RepID=A0AAD7D141_MYCRO|nr:hypothetical protein B0H17DRAFT_221789 [Mycena rosella]
MAITTLESQRRNSDILLETQPCNGPPPPCSQPRRTVTVRPAQNGSKTKTRPRPVHPRWESAQTIRRQRIQAAERAFLDARRGRFAPGLFTHTSLFGTLNLPPPGAKASNLDASAGDFRAFMIGDKVRVRRFNFAGKRPCWTAWKWGQVMLYLPMRSFAGNFGHAYVVRVISQLSGQETTGTFVQFMGEICSADGPDSEEDPCVSITQCESMRRRANFVYTRLDLPGTICEIPNKDVWIPAEIVVGPEFPHHAHIEQTCDLQTWEDGKDIFVKPLLGPTEGQKVRVRDAIPYTLETALACRKQGQSVMGPYGKLFMHDMDSYLKPLGEALPPTLPPPIFNFPSPDAMVAGVELDNPWPLLVRGVQDLVCDSPLF